MLLRTKNGSHQPTVMGSAWNWALECFKFDTACNIAWMYFIFKDALASFCVTNVCDDLLLTELPSWDESLVRTRSQAL